MCPVQEYTFIDQMVQVVTPMVQVVAPMEERAREDEEDPWPATDVGLYSLGPNK